MFFSSELAKNDRKSNARYGGAEEGSQQGLTFSVIEGQTGTWGDDYRRWVGR